MVENVRYLRNPNYIYRKIVDESVLVPVYNNVADMNCIYTLNGMGAFLWEHLAAPATRQELEALVLAEYNADPEVLVVDLEKFLLELCTIGAVQKV